MLSVCNQASDENKARGHRDAAYEQDHEDSLTLPTNVVQNGVWGAVDTYNEMTLPVDHRGCHTYSTVTVKLYYSERTRSCSLVSVRIATVL